VQEFNDKLQELHSVRAELERVRKDKNIISGLVNQTQRDMSSKVGHVIFVEKYSFFKKLIMN